MRVMNRVSRFFCKKGYDIGLRVVCTRKPSPKPCHPLHWSAFLGSNFTIQPDCFEKLHQFLRLI